MRSSDEVGLAQLALPFVDFEISAWHDFAGRFLDA
jgi:hypothetical protein